MTSNDTEMVNADGLIKTSPSTIYTFGGGSIDPLNPSPDDIDIPAIAHSLSNQCRWTGHTSRFYSVAEHSVWVSTLCPEPLALSGLLHDASEAYLSDLARPIKKAPGLGEKYREAEEKLELAICEAFYTKRLSDSPEIKAADEAMLWMEAKMLVPHLSAIAPQPPEGTPEVECWNPLLAEMRFLQRFAELTNMSTCPDPVTEVLPVESQARKDIPLTTGVLDYFPAALAEVARVSKQGNDKHNPGQELHWARSKSMDHANCIGRHLLERGSIDPDTGQRHSAQLAWRALALLQQELENEGLAPISRGSR